MQLERLEFEFDTGIDPLTGEKRPPVRAVSRPEDRFDLTLIRDVVEYSKHFPIRVDHEGPIMSLDENGDPKGRIDRSVYHVKTADGEWKVESKNQDLRDLTEKYGGDDYQKVY